MATTDYIQTSGAAGIKMRFTYTITPNESKRTAHVAWNITSIAYDEPGEWARYRFCQGNQKLTIKYRGKVGSEYKTITEKPTNVNIPKYYTSKVSGRGIVYNAITDSGCLLDKKYNLQEWFDTNGMNQGIHWWIRVLGTKWATGSFDTYYKDDGTIDFEVYGDFEWYGSGGRKTFSKTVSCPKIKKRYKITFNANGGSNAPSTIYKTHGVDLKVPTQEPTRKGYFFTGWATEKNGKNYYYPGKTISANKEQTLYANWHAENIPITYKPNGGKIDGKSTNNLKENKTYNKKYKVTHNATKTGYTFNYWDISPTGKTVKYNGTIIAESNRSDGYILTANYTPNTYKIIAKENKSVETDKVLNTFSQKYDSSIDKSTANSLKNYKREGYKQITDTKGNPLWTFSSHSIFGKNPTTAEIKELEKDMFVYMDSTTKNGRSVYKYAKDITIYPVLQYTTTCYIKTDSGWKLAVPYIKTDSGWKQAISYVKTDSDWKL